MATVQMNVRIDEGSKTKGDAVFAELGYTPTQVVRVIWEYAASKQDNRDEVEQLLSKAKQASGRSEEDELQRRMRFVEEGLAIFPRFLEEVGATDLRPFADDGLTPAERREQAAWMRALEKGWVHE